MTGLQSRSQIPGPVGNTSAGVPSCTLHSLTGCAGPHSGQGLRPTELRAAARTIKPERGTTYPQLNGSPGT